MFSRLGWRVGWLAVGAVSVAAYFIFSSLDESNDPAKFEFTLEDMRSDFGEEAPVLSVYNRDGAEDGIIWEVLSPEGRVTKRAYTTETSTSSGPEGSVTERERHEKDSDRPATAGDRKLAKRTLGELDPTVLTTLCERTEGGIGEGTGDFRLVSETWTLSNNTDSIRYRANYDGTGIKKVYERPGAVSLGSAICDL